MKPSWKDAPRWAKFLAQDQDESWWWYSVEPSKTVRRWVHDSGLMEEATVAGNNAWEETLEPRPTKN